MSTAARSITILLVDDDEDDCILTREALVKSQAPAALHCAGDGIELLRYLRHEGEFSNLARYPLPNLILMDLNMPRMDGREALVQLKADPGLRTIPVIILTTSNAEQDMLDVYALGAASFITKPATFSELVELMKTLCAYWAGFVELPNRR